MNELQELTLEEMKSTEGGFPVAIAIIAIVSIAAGIIVALKTGQ